MIIETKADVVRLSGSLYKNQWMAIKAAANLLLHAYPRGIIVDCSGLQDISEDGARTFLEAMRDIQAAKSRIVVTSLPEGVLAVLKTVPGVRSQLPIATTVEEARASLRVAYHPASVCAHKECVVLVPLVSNLDLTYGAHLAGRLAHSLQAELRLVYFLAVPRNLPLNAPLAEQEQAAQTALNLGVRYARQHGVPVSPYVERVREQGEGILAAVRAHEATTMVIGCNSEPEDIEARETFDRLVHSLLDRASCEVIVGRLSLPMGIPSGAGTRREEVVS